MQLNLLFLMLHNITSGKDNNYCFQKEEINFVDLNEKKNWEKKGGSQILGCMYTRGGVGVLCATGGWGV